MALRMGERVIIIICVSNLFVTHTHLADIPCPEQTCDALLQKRNNQNSP